MQQVLESLNVPRNTSTRMDCICGGKNTLSVSNRNGKLVWNCFKASCTISGSNKIDMSMQDIKDAKLEKAPMPLRIGSCVGWDNIAKHTNAIEYLEKNHCMEAYSYYPNKYFYDTIKKRVVFTQHESLNSFSIAVGRSLIGQLPKWYNYIKMPKKYFTSPYLHGSSDTAYITEDCASASSTSRVGNGIALCGTTYDIMALCEAINFFRASYVVICLDKDALNKAHELATDLRGFGKNFLVKVASLSDDPKYLSSDILKKELKL